MSGGGGSNVGGGRRSRDDSAGTEATGKTLGSVGSLQSMGSTSSLGLKAVSDVTGAMRYSHLIRDGSLRRYNLVDEDQITYEENLKFPKSFDDAIQHRMIELLGPIIEFISCRVNELEQKATRRNSMRRVAGKPVVQKSKSIPIGHTGEGFLTPHNKFLPKDRQYNVLDNNVLSGAFPEGVVADEKLGSILRDAESGNIRNVMRKDNLIYYNAVVEEVDKSKKAVIRSNGVPVLKRKHYVQCADSLRLLFNNLIEGHYTFIKQKNGQIFLEDKLGNNIMLDLNLLIPNDGRRKDSDVENKEDFEEIKNTLIDFFADKKLNRQNIQEEVERFRNRIEPYDVEACHVPIFKNGDRKNDVWVPFMIMLNDKGLPITQDVDVEHVSIPLDFPSIVHVWFSSFKPNALEDYKLGLKILIARFEKKTSKEFLAECRSKNISDEQLRRYLCGLELDHPNLYQPMQQPKFLQSAKNVLQALEKNPVIMEQLGVMDLFTVVLRFTIDNDYFLHGPEAQHPFTTPEPFVGIGTFMRVNISTKDVQTKAANPMARFASRSESSSSSSNTIESGNNYDFAHTNDEIAYIQLLCSKQFLERNNIDVHPQWVRKRDNNEQKISDAWVKIIEIQALMQLLRGIKVVNGTKQYRDYEVFYRDYMLRLENTMRQGRDPDPNGVNVEDYAMDRINASLNRFKKRFTIADPSKITNDELAEIKRQITLTIKENYEFISEIELEQVRPGRSLSGR